MNQQTYSLLITVLGALIPGIFGVINTIITLRARRVQKVDIGRTDQVKSEPTEPVIRKGHSRMLLLTVLIGVGTAGGFFIGNATKKSPSVVRHYNQEEQMSVATDRIAEIDHQIHETQQERDRIVMQPNLPQPEKEEMIRELDERIDQLRMEKAEFREIIDHPEIPENIPEDIPEEIPEELIDQ